MSMGSPSSPPAALLALLLIFWTGSSWFVALHPRMVWRMLLRRGVQRGAGIRVLRWAALASGCLGLGLLLLPIL